MFTKTDCPFKTMYGGAEFIRPHEYDKKRTAGAVYATGSFVPSKW